MVSIIDITSINGNPIESPPLNTRVFLRRLFRLVSRVVLQLLHRKYCYYPALERAGITRRLTPHATRHTFATLLARAKIQPVYAQALMGHSDYSTTANTYTHLPLEELRAAIEAI